MALTVTTDLTVITTAEVDSAWDDIGALSAALEPDFFVQGSNCLSRAVSGATKGMAFNNGAGIDFTTGTHKDKLVYIWMKTNTPGLCDTRANGGVRVRLGTLSATTGYREWYVDGSDTLVATDGWVCYVIDPQSAGSSTTGAYDAASVRWFGGTMTATTTAKGQNFGIDQIAYGRGEIYVSGTVATAGAGFKEIADVAYDVAASNRWGIITVKQGIYFVKGKIIIGHATSNTTFSSYNETVLWETPAYKDATNVVKTIPDASVGGTAGADGLTTYNGLAFRGGSGTTAIDFGVIVGTANGRSGTSFTCVQNPGLSTPGKTKAWVTVDNSTMSLSLYSSSFSGFEGGVDLTGTGVDDDDCFNTSFIGCGRLTSNMEIRNCNILNSVAAADDGAYLWDSTTNLQSCLFVNNSRAIVFEATTGTPFAFTGITFGGNTYDVRNESNGAITINVSGGSTPTVENIGSSTTSVVAGAVSATAKAVTEAGTAISGAAVHIEAALNDPPGGEPFPVDVTVTISNSGTTATVTHTAHGMATNDKVVIRGASLDANNGVFAITKINDNSYSYVMGSAPGSNPTGTIKSTFVVLNGTTGAGGEVTMSRVFPSDQPVTGRIRKSSAAPYYKQASISGTVDSGTGAYFTGVMISDD